MALANRMTVWIFRFAWWIGSRASERSLRLALRSIALVVWAMKTSSVQRLRFNLARVMDLSPGSKASDAVAKSALLGYFDYWASIFCMPRRSRQQVADRVELLGNDLVKDLLEAGERVLVVAPHSGNWDLAGAWAADRYAGLTTVAERLEPVEIFDLFVQARTVRDVEILPHKGGERRPLDVLRERLLQGRLVGLAADRDLSRRGVPVSFFGHPTRMPAGPAQLALVTGCVLVPLALGRSGDKLTVEYLKPLAKLDNVEQLTQSMANSFADIIGSRPQQWFMLQQVWLDHPRAWGGRP